MGGGASLAVCGDGRGIQEHQAQGHPLASPAVEAVEAAQCVDFGVGKRKGAEDVQDGQVVGFSDTAIPGALIFRKGLPADLARKQR